jgi:protein TonB
MFEDATFESTDRIRTRSRGWMLAALAFNSSILLALVLIPLICPEAIPNRGITLLQEWLTPPPAAQQLEQKQAAPAVSHANTNMSDPFAAPTKIPNKVLIVGIPEVQTMTAIGSSGAGVPWGVDNPVFNPAPPPRIVHPEEKRTMRVSGMVEAGLLLHKTIPVYPALAKAAHVSGTVVLEAIISKNGTIENLRVASGPPLLQKAALDAVQSWVYRPYLLNSEPVEVETTVNVIFTLAQ